MYGLMKVLKLKQSETEPQYKFTAKKKHIKNTVPDIKS